MKSARSYFVAAAILAAATFATACQAAPGPSVSPPSGAVVIGANANQFEPRSVSAPADAAFTIWFDNREAVPHNVRVADSTGATVGTPGEIFTGPAAQPLSVPALAPGTYRLLCDVHPDMTAEMIAGS